MKNVKISIISIFLLIYCYSETILAHPRHVANAFSSTENLPSKGSTSDYRIFKSNKYDLIYNESNQKDAAYVATNLEALLKHQEEHFGWTLRSKLKVVIVGNEEQIGDASATPSPFNVITLYNSGRLFSSRLINGPWINSILTHETSHSYQLDTGDNIISKGTGLISKHQPIKLSFLPFYASANVLTSRVFLEGSAVLNESRFNQGGRVNSGEYRAIYRAITLADGISLDRLHSRTDIFPIDYGYVIGSQFWYYLSDTYGYEKADSFFLVISRNLLFHYLYYQIDDAFEEIYDKGLAEVHDDFIAYSKEIAQGFTPTKFIKKLSAEPSLTNTYLISKQDGIIRSLETGNLKSTPILHSFDTKTKKYTQYEESLINGKVYLVDGELYTTASFPTSSGRSIAGLLDSSFQVKANTEGKLFLDMEGDHVIYSKTIDGFTSRVYLDDKPIEGVEIAPVLDAFGNIYYTKHDGYGNMVFYKNKKELFTLEHVNYGFIIEVFGHNIYFISDTKHGSGLFRYSKGIIQRMNPADDIVDARIIDENSVFVVTPTAEGYVVGITSMAPIDERVFIHEKIDLVKDFEFKPTDPTVEEKLQKTGHYNSFFDMEYSGLALTLGDSLTSAELIFTDPLMRNRLAFGYEQSTLLDAGSFDYTNSIFANLKIRYLGRISKTDKGISENKKNRQEKIDRKRKSSFLLQANDNYSFGKHHLLWSLTSYQDLENKNLSPNLLNLGYTYIVNYGANAVDYAKFNINALYRATNNVNITGGLFGIGHSFWDNIYASIDAVSLRVTNNKDENIFSDQAIIYSKFGNSQASNAGDYANTVLKAFTNEHSFRQSTNVKARLLYDTGWHAYSRYFPAALANTHLFVFSNQYTLRDELPTLDITTPTNQGWDIKSSGVGATFVFSILYRNQIKLEMSVENFNCGIRKCESKDNSVVNLNLLL